MQAVVLVTRSDPVEVEGELAAEVEDVALEARRVVESLVAEAAVR